MAAAILRIGDTTPAAASPFAVALAGVVALALALQARHHTFLAEAAPLAVAAIVARDDGPPAEAPMSP